MSQAATSGDLPRMMLSVEEVAIRWGVSPKPIYAAIQRGAVRAIRVGRVFRVPIGVVESIEQGRVVQGG